MLNKLTYQVISFCFEIHNRLGSTYKEKYYQRALERELRINNISYDREKSFYLKYKGKIIGKHYVDFIIDNRLILELKTVPILTQKDSQQLLMYLNSLQIKFGLLVNFRTGKVQLKRVVLPDKYLKSV
jgi:GxxExxY protein